MCPSQGAESLVSAGVVECLLDVIDWEAPEPNSITFVTRAVRVLDLITNVDVTAFHSHSGWSKLMRKLEVSPKVIRCKDCYTLSCSLAGRVRPVPKGNSL